MLKTEIASLMNENRKMFQWATAVDKNMNLSAEDKEISTVVDAWAKVIGEKGRDSNNEIAEYIIKTVQPEVYDVPDELLSQLFNRGSIGEFDNYQINYLPKNTLKSYEAARAGNVDKSYIDWTQITPTKKFLQIETELKYSDLRRNGYKTIANMTTFAEEEFKRKMFYLVFAIVDAAITGGDQAIVAGASNPTVVAMDALSLYLGDRGNNPMTVSLSKYAQAIAKMSGYSSYMSDNMKDEYNKYGLVKFYNGVKIGAISGAHKTGDDQLLITDKRIYGFADKIGDMDIVGNMRVYETEDNKNEKIELKLTGVEFALAISDITKVCKITMT